MKNLIALIVTVSASTLSGFGCASNRTAAVCACPCVLPAGSTTRVDAKSAEALRTALDDERRAQAFYQSVLARYGQVRPFMNIVHAEERHEAVLTALMERHGVEASPAKQGDIAAPAATLAACSLQAAQLERENIAMYDRLLADVSEPDIRAAFENLRAASEKNHLPAFERWSTTGTPMQTGRGPGRGAGWGGGYACTNVSRGPCPLAP